MCYKPIVLLVLASVQNVDGGQLACTSCKSLSLHSENGANGVFTHWKSSIRFFLFQGDTLNSKSFSQLLLTLGIKVSLKAIFAELSQKSRLGH